MSYKIFLHPKANESLDKLDKEINKRIKNKIKELKEKPDRKGMRLKYSDFFRIRVCDYRVIYEIDKTKNSVYILYVGHRKKVYDDFSKLF